MTLSAEIAALVRSKVLSHQGPADDHRIVREILETLAGREADVVLAAMKAAGGPQEFVQQLFKEVRRLRELEQQKA